MTGTRDYFLARRGWFFGLLIGWSVIDMIDTWIKGPGLFRVAWRHGIDLQRSAGPLQYRWDFVRRGTVQAVIAVGQLVYVVSGVLHLFNVVNFTNA